MALTKISRGLLSTGISDSSDATAITIDSSEKVGIGVTTPANYNFATPLAISAPSGANSGFTIVSATDSNGTIAMADGTSGTEAYKGFLQYSHIYDAMFIGAAGATVIRLDSDGVKFGSDTAAVNALDDYEEGSWTPTIIGDGGASGQSYSIQYGTYTKIGNFVHMTFDVRLTALGTLSGTYVNIGGHGFTFKGNNIGGSGVTGYVANVSNSSHYPLTAYINATNVYLTQGGSGYITTGGNFINSNTILIGTITGIIA